MPKPVKKKAAAKRAASDPNRRAGQLMAEHMEKIGQGKWNDAPSPEPDPEPTFRPTDDLDTRSIISAYMKVLGAKGGKASGTARLQKIDPATRREIASQAARARWAKRTKKR